MKLPKDTELVAASVVAVLGQPPSAQALSGQQDLESALGGSVEVSQGLSAEGPTVRVRVPSQSLEIVLSTLRVQCNVSGAEPNKDRAALVAKAFHLIVDTLTGATWTALGYNYTMAFPAPGERRAVEVIWNRLLSHKSIEKRLGRPVLGAAVWLYFDEDGKAATIKVEPRGGQREALRIWATANYHQPLNGTLPDQQAISADFGGLFQSFRSTLTRIL